MKLTRREAMKGAVASLAVGLTARGQTMEAPPEKSAIVLIFFQGGYNAFFTAADGYLQEGLYGCTPSTVRSVGNDVYVDASTFGTLPDAVLARMATVGVAHGASGHDYAVKYAWTDMRDGVSIPLKLASALKGTAAFRCVHFGQPPGGMTHKSYDGIPMLAVPDLAAALALVSNVAGTWTREHYARALEASIAYGQRRFRHSPRALVKTWEGTHTLIQALRQPVQSGIDWNEIASAYGLEPGQMSAVSFRSQLAGAELMLRAGADVICITSHDVMVGNTAEDWDTHGDGTGELARTMMRSEIIPPLKVFLERTLAAPGLNTTTLLYGDFARMGGNSPTASEHANGLSATVFGKNVRPGTTGRFTTRRNGSGGLYHLPESTPSYQGLWAYLTELARAPSRPFGPNPHTSIA